MLLDAIKLSWIVNKNECQNIAHTQSHSAQQLIVYIPHVMDIETVWLKPFYNLTTSSQNGSTI